MAFQFIKLREYVLSYLSPIYYCTQEIKIAVQKLLKKTSK